MKNLIVTLLLTFSNVIYAFDEPSHIDAHVHGLVEMNLVAEAGHIEVQITSPLMNLVGFEYAARTDAEKAAIQTMASTFETPHKWLKFDGNVCQLIHHTINHGDEHHDAHEHDHHGHESQHAELEANYRFKCESETLDSVTVSLQSHFPGIESITLNWIVGTASGSTTLHHEEHQAYFR